MIDIIIPKKNETIPSRPSPRTRISRRSFLIRPGLGLCGATGTDPAGESRRRRLAGAGGTRLRDPGGDPPAQGMDTVAALGDPLAADPAEALQAVLESVPEGGTPAGDTALLRLVLQDRFEIGVALRRLFGLLQAGALLVEVQDGAGAARGATAGLFGEVARLARCGAPGGAVVPLAQRGEAAGLEDVAAEAQPVVVALDWRVGWLGRVRLPLWRCRGKIGSVGLLVVVEELAAAIEQLLCPRGVAAGAVAGAVPGRAVGLGALAVPAGTVAVAGSAATLGSVVALVGLVGFRPRSGTAPVYVEIEIEFVCHVRWATPVSPAPGSRLRLDSDSKDTGRRGLLQPPRSSSVRPGGSGESSIGPMAEFPVPAGISASFRAHG